MAVAEGPTVERLELEVQFGPRAAEKLPNQITIIDEDTQEGKAFLLKLKKILETEDRNRTSSSESSSSSSSRRRSRSRSSSSSSLSSSMSSSGTTEVRIRNIMCWLNHQCMCHKSVYSFEQSFFIDFQTTTIMEPFRRFHKDRVTTENKFVNNIVYIDQTLIRHLCL